MTMSKTHTTQRKAALSPFLPGQAYASRQTPVWSRLVTVRIPIVGIPQFLASRGHEPAKTFLNVCSNGNRELSSAAQRRPSTHISALLSGLRRGRARVQCDDVGEEQGAELLLFHVDQYHKGLRRCRFIRAAICLQARRRWWNDCRSHHPGGAVLIQSAVVRAVQRAVSSEPACSLHGLLAGPPGIWQCWSVRSMVWVGSDDPCVRVGSTRRTSDARSHQGERPSVAIGSLWLT